MTPTTIQCPHCHQTIEISEALTHGLRESILNEELPKIEAREKALGRKEQEILKRETTIETAIAKRIAEEKKTLTATIREELRLEAHVELADLREQLTSKAKELAEVKKKELALLAQQRALEDEKEDLELTVRRRLTDERKVIKKQITESLDEEHRLERLNNELKTKELQDQIEILKRKAAQGSQQTQGEALEVKLEEILRATFPMDLIEEVKKGVSGADVKQYVRNSLGKTCGMILWESKSTRNWSDGWIQKLKDNAVEAKADVCVILTTVLPKNVENFELIESSVWVTNYASFRGLSIALRQTILSVAQSKAAEARRQDVQSHLYDYLTSVDFRNRMESILMPFVTMQKDLDSEIRTTQTRWAKRKKQLDRVVTGISGFQGELEGVIGEPFKQLKALEFVGLPEGEEEVEE